MASKATARAEILQRELVQSRTEIENLQARLREKENLAAVGANHATLIHEISNSVQLISAYAQTLVAQTREDETLLKSLAVVPRDLADEANWLVTLTTQFRDFARVKRPRFQPTCLRTIVLAMIPQPEMVPYTRIKFKTDFPADMPSIMGDPDLLRIVFSNLIRNAIQAMPGGGTISIVASCTQDRILVEIHDTGTGISDKDIFEPFATTKPGGLGLGLPTVRDIIEAHCGTIAFESQPGDTVFRLNLPRSPVS